MQKKTRSKLLDVFVVVVCLSLCAASLYMFWKDLNSSTTRKDKDQIATIEFKRKVAQRKFNDRVVWERLQQNSPLYNNDIVRTADDAAAVVTFADGTVLELHENTMLKIVYTEDGLQISVNDGNIDVDTTASNQKQVSLAMDNGSTLKLDSGSKVTAASNTESGDNSFKLQSGNATVTTKSADGKATTEKITSGESVKVNATGEVKKEPLTVTSISSDARYYAFNGEKALPVKLQWNSSSAYENKKVIVETSYQKDFAKLENTSSISNKNSVTLSAPVGKVYWRVYPEGEQAQAAAGKITVENVPQVTAVSPVKNSVFTYRKDADLPKLTFKWNGNDYAEHYRLEVSANQDLSNPVISEQIQGDFYNTKSLPEGTYYWRVTPFYKIQSVGYGLPTSSSVFVIESKEKALPPKLSLPANNGKISFEQTKDNQLTFQWKSEVKTAEYKLQVSDKKDFSNIVYEADTSKTRVTEAFTLAKMPAGSYYWKVTRTSEEDNEPAVSEIRKYIVEKYIPEEIKLVYPPENFSVEAAKLNTVEFMWKLPKDYEGSAVESIIQVAPTNKFDRDVKEYKSEAQAYKDIELAKGNYYWRVGVEADSEVTYSAPRSIKVLGPLGTPVITAPAANSVIALTGDNHVKISWNPVVNADYYRVRVYNRNEKLVTEISSTKQTSASVVLEADVYKCTVQAFTEENEIAPRRNGKAGTVNFTVRSANPVQLLAPADNARISGLTAVKTPTVLSWKQGDKVEKAQLVLKKLQPNGTYKVVKLMENPRNQVRLERLEPGTYQWSINASGAGGTVLNSGVNTFVVTSIPELQAPKLISPTNGKIIDADYLKANRNIVFTWRPVDGATTYRFTLYQKNKNGTLKKLYEEKNYKATELRYKDLASLDVGEFEWNVTAFSYAADGYEEQKGKVSTGNFKISFELPGKVKTIDPGKLYGE